MTVSLEDFQKLPVHKKIRMIKDIDVQNSDHDDLFEFFINIIEDESNYTLLEATTEQLNQMKHSLEEDTWKNALIRITYLKNNTTNNKILNTVYENVITILNAYRDEEE